MYLIDHLVSIHKHITESTTRADLTKMLMIRLGDVDQTMIQYLGEMGVTPLMVKYCTVSFRNMLT